MSPCVKETAGGIAEWLRELKQGLCISLEGGMGRETGEGTYVHLWLIHVDV